MKNSILQELQDKLFFDNQVKPLDWDIFTHMRIKGKSLPIYLEFLNMNDKFDEMDQIFNTNSNFVECFKCHMKACGFKMNYNFNRLNHNQ